MADKYWVGGGSSSNWDAASNTNWSATDGGANNASVPANGDDVFLKSAADCALNTHTANLNSFDMTSYTGTLSGTQNIKIKPSSGTVVCKIAGTVTWVGYIWSDPQGSAVHDRKWLSLRYRYRRGRTPSSAGTLNTGTGSTTTL